MFGYFSTSVERLSDLMQNPYFVYDITFLEWEKRKSIKNDGKVYFCTSGDNDNFEVISKRDFCYIIVVFTNKRKELAENMFNKCRKLINELDGSLPWLHKSNTIAIYRQIIRAIQINSNWTSTHIAAKIGLDVFFDANELITEEINRQVLPDLMTPLHLAIQNSNLSVVRALIEHDSNLDLVDINGYNSLHYAAISTVEILMFVLSLPLMFERAKAKTKKGCTPLHLACYAHKLENVNIFLRYGLTVSMLTLLPPCCAQYTSHFSKSNLTRQQETRQVDPIVKFTDKEIDDLEVDFIFYGGTPLHWTKKKSEMERLLEYGFDMNAPNAKGETALILKTRRMRFKCLMSLLCHGANVNQPDTYGNIALYYAVRQGDVTITQALVVFDCDIDHVNKKKESIRHVAAILPKENINHQMVLYVVSSLGAKRCVDSMQGCKEGCIHGGTFDGKRFIRWPVFSGHKFYRNLQLKEVIREEKHKLKDRKDSNLINMVSFDGGGIKGLITVQMIHDLQKRLKRNFIDYFDWVSGTSTGSIIAVALLQGKSTQDIRSIYFRLKDKVMTGTRPYNSELIEKLLKEELDGNTKITDFYTKHGKFCLIPATLVDRLPVQMHLFRSYPSPEMVLNRKLKVEKHMNTLTDYKDPLVWKVIRASAAAPTYFNTFECFVDGGILSNNPTMDMLVEFNSYNYAVQHNQQNDVKKLNAVVSFGTGQVKPKPFSLPELTKFFSWNPRELTKNLSYIMEMFNIIIDSACNTDYHVVDRNESWCATNRVPFFRLNPDLIETMNLNETEDAEIVNCMWMTKVYIHSKKDAIDELIYFLESTRNNESNTPTDNNK